LDLLPEEDKPTAWFDPLYAGADEDGTGVPWANMATHPGFDAWLAKNALDGKCKTALIVGCGMGDDAIELASHGFSVTAFDVSDAAIAHCRRRFPDISVDFRVADLFNPPSKWKRRFDFLLEIYTIQALPPKYEQNVIGKIADFVRETGQLVTVAIVSDEPRTFESGPPWALTPGHQTAFVQQGLTLTDHQILSGASRRGNDLWVSTLTRPCPDSAVQ